jgi:D-aminopeptidase
MGPPARAANAARMRPFTRYRSIRAITLASAVAALASSAATSAATVGIPIGFLPPGPLDAITDVAGVRVGQVTKIEGSGPLQPGIGPVRTGVTVIVPNDDPWNARVAAATYDLNGNGEMTGSHWVNEAGFMEVPIALTNTLDVARVDDGVIDWMVRRYPNFTNDDVPLPIVAECDDQALNDIVGRHVMPSDVVRAIEGATSGAFARGSVGGGTGMRAFAFKAGIGTASRIAGKDAGAYTVGVLVNANTGARTDLRINGVPIGRAFARELLPVFPKGFAFQNTGRAVDGSIIVVVATNAPLDHRQLRELTKRAVLGLGRTGATSHVSSGDLLIAFSTSRIYPRDPKKTASTFVVNDEGTLDALFAATAEATEAAVDDSLFNATTMSGADGNTYFGLPLDRVRSLLRAAGAIPPR